jgi:hypothetical protein
MSYTSTSVLAASTTSAQAQDVVDLLGFKKVRDGLKVPNRVSGYFWYDETDYRSWSGVELDIYKTARGPVKVTTRSSASRSYWDLVHQNRTLKLLRDLFGGRFETDAGKNRYWRPDEPPPTPLSSGCYLARWRFKNNLQRASIYLMHRKLEGQIAKDEPSGLGFIDEINPRLLSNNMVVPYVIAVWEEYFRATFSACLRYSRQREAALKRAKLSHSDLEKLVVGTTQVDRAVAEAFSFQRPSAIADTFKLIDPKLDLAGTLRKPYRGRKQSLFDSLEALVEDRNRLVHTGEINVGLFDMHLRTVLSDLTEAVNRAYNQIAKHNNFVPNHSY